MTSRLLGLLAVAAALSACTTVQHLPLSADASAALNGRRVISTQYKAPDFTAMTPTKAAFGLLGAAAMISEGNQLVKDNGIVDPALAIADGLGQRLVQARSVQLQPAAAPAASDELPALLGQTKGADYLLDVKTMNWMFSYYPSAWGSYRVTYQGRLRLIDVASGKVAAESMCTTVQGNDEKPPSQDELLADKAALLKSYLAKASVACVDVLAKDVIRL